MAIASMQDLFLHTLKDVYYAEKAIAKALPKMMKKAQSEELATALEMHREETLGQIEQLEQIFEMLGKPARGVKCEAMDGILAEAQDHLAEIEDPHVRDAAIIASAQAVEHYEICRYGSLIAWANALGHDEMVGALQTILDQEKAADMKLSDLAEGVVNPVAVKEAGARETDGADQANESPQSSAQKSSSGAKAGRMSEQKPGKMADAGSAKKSAMKKAS
ncbi:MAG: ferritin-like domain-containing protein [Hyphomicrobiales bacterium]|nr:ferritin-like domain-containing protein [Hyphomicrobiales bacterium]